MKTGLLFAKAALFDFSYGIGQQFLYLVQT